MLPDTVDISAYDQFCYMLLVYSNASLSRQYLLPQCGKRIHVAVKIGVRAGFSRGGAEPSLPEKFFDSARKKLPC